MNKKFNRNNVLSINIVDNIPDVSDSVQYLIPLQGSLFSFADNNIYKILPAESMDSANLHPETRHSYQKIYSIYYLINGYLGNSP